MSDEAVNKLATAVEKLAAALARMTGASAAGCGIIVTHQWSQSACSCKIVRIIGGGDAGGGVS